MIPAVVEPHGHGAYEGLDTRGALVVAGSEAASHILVVQHLHLECEVFFKILYDHDEEGQLDAQGFLRVSWTGDVCGAHIGAHNLQHKRLDVVVCYTLDVTIPDLRSN